MDGSQKLPQRWFATVAERLVAGQNSPYHLRSIAAWIAYTAQAPAIAHDPMLQQYAVISAEAGADAHQLVKQYVSELSLFPSIFRDNSAFVASLVEAVLAWRADPRASLSVQAE